MFNSKNTYSLIVKLYLIERHLHISAYLIGRSKQCQRRWGKVDLQIMIFLTINLLNFSSDTMKALRAGAHPRFLVSGFKPRIDLRLAYARLSPNARLAIQRLTTNRKCYACCLNRVRIANCIPFGATCSL